MQIQVPTTLSPMPTPPGLIDCVPHWTCSSHRTCCPHAMRWQLCHPPNGALQEQISAFLDLLLLHVAVRT